MKATLQQMQQSYACSIATIGTKLLVRDDSAEGAAFGYYEQAMLSCLSWLREEGVH